MANGLFDGGTGTQKDPFLISDGADLFQVKNHLTSYFKLVSNINLGEPPYNKDFGWQPIEGFKGQIDGNNKRIYNLTIVRNDTDNVGLFADYAVNTIAPINNVSFENVSIRGKDNVGAIVGKLKLVVNTTALSPVFDNVYVNGVVEGNNSVGSLVGNVELQISNDNQTFTFTQDCLINTQLGLTNADTKYIGQVVGVFTDSSNGLPQNREYPKYLRTIGLAQVSNASRKLIEPGNFSYDLNARDRFEDCFLDSSLWRTSDFNNPNTGLQIVDSSVIKNIENQTAFDKILNADKTHKWSLYDKQYPQLTIMVPDYIFVKADEHFFYYNFTTNSWDELTLNKNKKVPSREQTITYGIRTLHDIPQEKWKYFQNNGFTTVNLYDGIDKTNTTFQHTVAVNDSLLEPIMESGKQSDNPNKMFVHKTINTNSVFGILTSIKGW